MAQGLLASQLEKLPGENAWVKNGEHLRHTDIHNHEWLRIYNLVLNVFFLLLK